MVKTPVVRSRRMNQRWLLAPTQLLMKMQW
jgi:hypothetical protein